MATYTGNQLYGQGAPIEALTAGTPYTIGFRVPSYVNGSTYFTFETVRNNDGIYDSTSAKNAVGTFTSLNNVQTLITSSYIFSVVVHGRSSLIFTPSNNIAISGSFLRTTGNTEVTIS
tara:strand:+ start:1994 stop:2347 length:354 start_codon:yes stop_codon:yes gene_type:complete